ncbi:unnamed protein product [Caenorhabditis auriculariae]|uniref:Uncharacterized protein n=1 Tax=Caenorhabditis auriculariae TaxID=2777116 RepID=A0A8S1H4Y5_9PELO|nr:unnamed protein product [Caenorhabditis auriculariae]
MKIPIVFILLSFLIVQSKSDLHAELELENKCIHGEMYISMRGEDRQKVVYRDVFHYAGCTTKRPQCAMIITNRNMYNQSLNDVTVAVTYKCATMREMPSKCIVANPAGNIFPYVQNEVTYLCPLNHRWQLHALRTHLSLVKLFLWQSTAREMARETARESSRKERELWALSKAKMWGFESKSESNRYYAILLGVLTIAAIYKFFQFFNHVRHHDYKEKTFEETQSYESIEDEGRS